jgi:hypothetical protein
MKRADCVIIAVGIWIFGFLAIADAATKRQKARSLPTDSRLTEIRLPNGVASKTITTFFSQPKLI